MSQTLVTPEPRTIFTASTRDVPAFEKVDYWTRKLSRIWGQIQIEPTCLDTFDGDIRSARLNRLVFNEIKFSGHNLNRTRANVSRMDQAFYSLAFPRGNPWQISQKDRQFTLAPGTMYLLLNTIPYRSHDRKGYETFNIIIPARMLENLVPYPEPRYFFPLDRANKKADILHDFVKGIYRSLPMASEEEDRFMEASLLNLLAYLLKESGDTVCTDDSSVKLAHRRRILDYIDTRLGDESLDPERIARVHGISVSYLHRIFKPVDRTVGDIIRTRRLDRSREMLEDPVYGGLSVTEIAFHNGFKHLSDFSRAFKRRFGLSPKACRMSADSLPPDPEG